MATTTDTPARDAVLVKYLNEAFGKEKQLETNLEALISRATNHKALKKGFQDHLKVTKNQARELQKRIKALGGKAETVDLPGPEAVSTAAQAAQNVANRAAALAQGPLHVLRGTGEQEKLLKNAKTQFQDEAEEIATYSSIETLAELVGDKETAKVAKAIRREEERMQKFLERQIKSLVGEVVKDEVPASERSNGTRRSSSRRTTRSTNGSSAASSRRTTSRSTNGASASSNGRSTTKRKAAAQKAAATRTRKAASSSAKSTAKTARTTAKKAGTTAKKTARAARSTAKSAARS